MSVAVCILNINENCQYQAVVAGILSQQEK
jgi:hypothetical protein